MINAHLRERRADTEKDAVTNGAASATDMERDIVAESAADMAKSIAAASAARPSPGGKVVKAKNIGGSGQTPPPSPIDEAPTFELEQPLSLLVGTGAMTHVAGRGWEALCGNVSTEGFNVRGVGGGVPHHHVRVWAGGALAPQLWRCCRPRRLFLDIF